MAEPRALHSPLEGQTLTTPAVSLDYRPVAFLPEVTVVKIGGQSIIDRGRKALFPILDELVAAKPRHKLLVCCGGGTRARHIYSIASELQMPTGVLAALGAYV